MCLSLAIPSPSLRLVVVVLHVKLDERRVVSALIYLLEDTFTMSDVVEEIESLAAATLE
jgi:hypothetical protein